MRAPSAPDLRQELELARGEIARLHRVVELKDEHIRWLNFKFFGPKSEKLAPDQIQLLFQEVSVMAGEVEQEAQRPQPAAAQPPQPQSRPPRGPHAGREPLPQHLERREEILPCCPEDCRCDRCGAERPIIGYETREELACEPAKFWVRVVKREKRGSHCLEEQGVATAPAPAQIVPKGKLSNEFIIEVLVR
jgi:transposase